jgi:hypothetical protein
MDSMEWKLEIPGQFHTPLRIRRQRATAEVTYSLPASNAEQTTPAATHYVCVITLLTHMRS